MKFKRVWTVIVVNDKINAASTSFHKYGNAEGYLWGLLKDAWEDDPIMRETLASELEDNGFIEWNGSKYYLEAGEVCING